MLAVNYSLAPIMLFLALSCYFNDLCSKEGTTRKTKEEEREGEKKLIVAGELKLSQEKSLLSGICLTHRCPRPG